VGNRRKLIKLETLKGGKKAGLPQLERHFAEGYQKTRPGGKELERKGRTVNIRKQGGREGGLEETGHKKKSVTGGNFRKRGEKQRWGIDRGEENGEKGQGKQKSRILGRKKRKRGRPYS